MNAAALAPVVCLSYLAAADLWTVPRYPDANSGAVITAVEQSIAADAPMTAAVLAALGHPTLLLTNRVGDDPAGQRITCWLAERGITTTAGSRRGVTTPHITVVGDAADSRTWFLHLAGAAEDLASVDLAALDGAPLAYIDAYPVIQDVAVAAIRAAASALTLVNIGSTELTAPVQDAMRAHPKIIVQANVDDERHEDAVTIAAGLSNRTGARLTVVTAGAYGAIALSRTGGEFVQVPGFAVQVRHTHCAGAAFSGGLLAALAADLSPREALLWGCASGALRCELPQRAPLPDRQAIQAFLDTRRPVVRPSSPTEDGELDALVDAV
ncbi:hypothetical protein GCM10009839_13800 [Catenulispora yoronensis]|uniref:Carbohydrate kinase PfkB domain-containing protein n=1 Tax=Catenulispora yoronensis TaxID=450799 RepID=A0ABN2TSB9_9ACTN